jgi:hypothetical protein
MFVELLIFLFSTWLVNEFEFNKLLQSDYWPPDQNLTSAPRGSHHIEVERAYDQSWRPRCTG